MSIRGSDPVPDADAPRSPVSPGCRGQSGKQECLDIAPEAAFVFEAATEAGGGKEIEEARYDPARNIDPAKGAKVQRQVAAETPHDDAEQRQRAAAVNTAVGQRAFGHIFRLQIFRQTTV